MAEASIDQPEPYDIETENDENQADVLPTLDRAVSEFAYNTQCDKCSLIEHNPLDCGKAKQIFNSFSTEQDRNEVFEALDMIFIINSCTICPYCSQLYQKRGGCDNMYCLKCQKSFMFQTLKQILNSIDFKKGKISSSNTHNGQYGYHTGYTYDFESNLKKVILQTKNLKKLATCAKCWESKLLDKTESATKNLTQNKYLIGKATKIKNTKLLQKYLSLYVCTGCTAKSSITCKCGKIIEISWHKECVDCFQPTVKKVVTQSLPILNCDTDHNSNLTSHGKLMKAGTNGRYVKQYAAKRTNFTSKSSYQLERELQMKFGKRDLRDDNEDLKHYKDIDFKRSKGKVKKVLNAKIKSKAKSTSRFNKYTF